MEKHSSKLTSPVMREIREAPLTSASIEELNGNCEESAIIVLIDIAVPFQDIFFIYTISAAKKYDMENTIYGPLCSLLEGKRAEHLYGRKWLSIWK